MAGITRWERAGMAAAWLLRAAAPTHAQDAGTVAPPAPVSPPTYKCVSKGKVVYTQVPCAGGQQISASGAHKTDKYVPPPQDRAKAARRAQLTPEVREECTGLEGRIKEQDAEFKAKGPGATVQDETPLVKSRLKFHELKC
jgi:hypothetical protein